MTTVLDQVRRTRRMMYGGFRYQRNRLAADIDADDLYVPFEHPQTGLARGSILNVGLEKMYVISYSSASAEVQRGIEGSIATPHQRDGAGSSEVEINPRFSGYDIACAVVDCVRGLPDSLYPDRTSQVTVAAGQTVVDLADDVQAPVNLVAVRQHRGAGDSSSMVPLVRNSSLVGGMADTFGTGGGLRLGRYPAEGGSLWVTYTYAFEVTDPVGELDDLVTGWGLAPSMLDIPALGAAAALTQAQEVERSDTTTQGEPRRAEEVPPMYASQMSDAIYRRYQRRIAEESMKLVARRGIKS